MEPEKVRHRTGVVVTASHPRLGEVYWRFVSEASVNGPDFHGITCCIDAAVLLEEGWRDGNLFLIHGHHISMVIRELETKGDRLLEESGQSADEFCAWLRSAVWTDKAGQVRLEHLVDHGFFSVWEPVPERQ